MNALWIVVLGATLGFSTVQAEETVGEKTSAAAKEVGRKMKKGANRAKEAVCMEGDMKCTAKKGGHRVDEAGSSIGDKAGEVKDKVD